MVSPKDLTPFQEVAAYYDEARSVYHQILDESFVVIMTEHLVKSFIGCITRGGKIILAGNGGSFADAIHFAGELTGRFKKERKPIATYVLGSNSSTLTAVANDYGFEHVFAREIEAIGAKGDIFIALSTSGNSKNILNAIKKGVEMGIECYCFTGEKAGEAEEYCPVLAIPSRNVPRIQEAHTTVAHVICELVEKRLFK